jgi:hypothetical protein
MRRDRCAVLGILTLASSVYGATLAVPTEARAHFGGWGPVLDGYNHQIAQNAPCSAAQISLASDHLAVASDGWSPLFAGVDEYSSQVARNASCSASQVSFGGGDLAVGDGWGPLLVGIDEYNNRIARNASCGAFQVSSSRGHIAIGTGRLIPLFAGIDGYNEKVARNVSCGGLQVSSQMVVGLPEDIAKAWALGILPPPAKPVRTNVRSGSGSR